MYMVEDVIRLFCDGLVIGLVLTAIPFIVGVCINCVIRILNS